MSQQERRARQLKRARKKYRRTPRGRYVAHKINAKRRGVPFEMTFDQWWSVWDASGMWSERGTNGAHMCRHGDEGAYSVGNVYIGTKAENCAERNRIWAQRMAYPEACAAR